MSKICLEGSGIVPVIGEFEAASMAQHVGMNLEAEPTSFASTFNHPRKARSGEWRTAFRGEQER